MPWRKCPKIIPIHSQLTHVKVSWALSDSWVKKKGVLTISLLWKVGSVMWRKQSSGPKVCRGKGCLINTPRHHNTTGLQHVAPVPILYWATATERKKNIWESQVNFEEEMKLRNCQATFNGLPVISFPRYFSVTLVSSSQRKSEPTK